VFGHCHKTLHFPCRRRKVSPTWPFPQTCCVLSPHADKVLSFEHYFTVFNTVQRRWYGDYFKCCAYSHNAVSVHIPCFIALPQYKYVTFVSVSILLCKVHPASYSTGMGVLSRGAAPGTCSQPVTLISRQV
jgi:hypothetical protein